MRALLYGVRPEPVTAPAGRHASNRLLEGLARTPMRLVELDDPGFLLPDWVVTRPRLTGICGSDAKQVFMDWGEVRTADNPMKAFFSLPQVLGHEVVADVVALGPRAEGIEVGDRVVLNPWLTCAPRGVRPVCGACERGDLSLCASFDVGPIAPGIHTGNVARRHRRLRGADARAPLDAARSAPGRARRGGRAGRPVRGDAARDHAAPARPARSRHGVRRRGARDVRDGDPARAVPRGRGARRRPLRGAGGDGPAARRDGGGSRSAARGDRAGRGVVGRGAAAERRPPDGVPGRDRRRVRHRRQTGDVRGRYARAGGPGAPS